MNNNNNKDSSSSSSSVVLPTTSSTAFNEYAQRTRAIFQIKRLFRKVFQVLNIEHQNLISHTESTSASGNGASAATSSCWYSEPTLRTNSERFPPHFYSSAVVWRARRNLQIVFPEVRMRQPSSEAETVAMIVSMMTIAKADDKNSLFRWMAESGEAYEKFLSV